MTDTFQARVARDLVVVDGPDATSFLQSLLSQDLDGVEVGSSVHALLLQPQGKLLVDVYTHRRADNTWWLVCEGGFGATLHEGLARFKIRVKAEIEAVPVDALAVRGARPRLEDGALACVTVDWGGAEACDIVGPAKAMRALALDLPMLDDAGYERARIEAGVPRQGFDVDERTIPQEAGLELHAVSFTKGCFVGQELVCRIDTRGHVNRLLRRLRADAPVSLGDAVTLDGKSVGEVTSSAGEVALAMLRHEVEPGSRVDVGPTSAAVEPAF
ncbi:MAG TPA: hypothetical protein VFR41_09445 [Acidimicrobiia bacterium]|nr:hypothetical protein [Acidimicrobiia bacterium]